MAKERTTRTLLMALVLIGLALRIGYVWTLGNRVFWGDESEYHGGALRLLAGEGFAGGNQFGTGEIGPTAYRPPGFPALLAGLYLLFGPHLFVARVFQALLGTVVIWMAYALTRQFGWSALAGLIAAAGAALYPYYIYCAGAVYPVVICTFLAVLAALLLLRGRRRRDLVMESGAGIATGAATLMAPYFALAAPLVALWVWKNKKASSRTAVAAGVAAAAACAIVVAPWMVRNEIVLGKPVLGTNFQYVFWLGNNDRATPSSGNRIEPPPDMLARASGMTELEAADYYMDKALADVRERPAHFALLTAAKAALFWRFYPDPATNVEHNNRRNLIIGTLSFGPVLLLGLAFMVVHRRQMRTWALYWCYLLPVWAAGAITIPKDRHRYPLDVFLIIFAAALVAYVVERRRSEPGGVQSEQEDIRAGQKC